MPQLYLETQRSSATNAHETAWSKRRWLNAVSATLGFASPTSLRRTRAASFRSTPAATILSAPSQAHRRPPNAT